MRIRRPVPEPDALLRIAAERDAALRARDAWRRVAQGDGSQSISSLQEDHGLVPVTDEHVEELEREIRSESRPVRNPWAWWPAFKIAVIVLMMIVGVTALVVVAGRTAKQNDAERVRLSSIEHKLLRMEGELGMVKGDREHELFMHEAEMTAKLGTLKKSIEGYVKARIEFDETLDETRRKTAAMEIYYEYFDNEEQPAIAPSIEASTVPCTEVSGDELMDCLRLDTVQRIDKVRKAVREEAYRLLQQQQGQSNYSDTVVHSDRAQVDVRARAGNRSGGYSGSGNTEFGAQVYRGVPSVRADVLPEMRGNRSDEVPRIQREGR